jgi:coenzyme F420-0:L-glutamate ligase/coenzyme F420-1:gamma-L-glutamate ligase
MGSMIMQRVELIAIPGMPLVQTGDNLADLIAQALRANDLGLLDGDVLVVTSKIVSKAEDRWVDLDTVIPSEEALRVASQCGKDPREVALILSEAESISRVRQGVLIVRHRLGFVCANAGVDHSNTRPGGQWRLLLPIDPDGSARWLRQELSHRFDAKIGVVISDSHGRPFRMGTVGTAIGSAGLPALWDLRGRPDLFGTQLQVTEVGFADELAAAAGLVLGQSNEGIPVVLIRGLSFPANEDDSAADLIRPAALDLYR